MQTSTSVSLRKRVLVTGGSGFIGTNLVQMLSGDHDVLNVDIVPPRSPGHMDMWRRCDVRDKGGFGRIVREFEPHFAIHLAARTDLEGVTLSDYTSNTEGTQVVLECLDGVGSCSRVVFASSMYVCEPGYVPSSWTDYQPHTVYGMSKVVGEEIVRNADVSLTWTIVRPTSIWGPWFAEPYRKFFEMVLKRRYFGMSQGSCTKTFGYVENTIAQIRSILYAHGSLIASQTFYLGDAPAYQIDEWAEEIARHVPYRVPTVPLSIMQVAARIGDLGASIGIPVPLTSFRLRNMRTNNIIDVNPINRLVVEAPVPRSTATARTVQWLRNIS